MRNIFIRADSTAQIGAGHLMRCLALAQAWQDQAGKVTFISHCESDQIKQRILDEGFDFVPIEKPYPNPKDLSVTLKLLLGISYQLQTSGLSSTAIILTRLTRNRLRIKAINYSA
jgi:spore coat polysaccharide biosynthesis predicted glycosyltransferase SpsG